MKKIIILGGVGLGCLIASSIEKNNIAEVKGFLNDFEPVGTEIGLKKKFPVIGRGEDVTEMLREDKDIYVICGYGGHNDPEANLNRLHSLNIPRERFINVFDDMAAIPFGFEDIGVGLYFAPLSGFSPNTTIGDHTALFAQSYIGHDAVIGEFCHISHAIVGSYTQVGKGVHIGLGAAVREKVKIGDFALVGMGAVVIDDVPANAVVVGNPARIIRYRE